MYKSDFLLTALGFSLAAVATLEHWEDDKLLPFQRSKKNSEKQNAANKSECRHPSRASRSASSSSSPPSSLPQARSYDNDLVNIPSPTNRDMSTSRSRSSGSRSSGGRRNRADSPVEHSRPRNSSSSSSRDRNNNRIARDSNGRILPPDTSSSRGQNRNERTDTRRRNITSESSESEDTTMRRWHRQEREQSRLRREDDGWKEGRGVFRCGEY